MGSMFSAASELSSDPSFFSSIAMGACFWPPFWGESLNYSAPVSVYFVPKFLGACNIWPMPFKDLDLLKLVEFILSASQTISKIYSYFSWEPKSRRLSGEHLLSLSLLISDSLIESFLNFKVLLYCPGFTANIPIPFLAFGFSLYAYISLSKILGRESYRSPISNIYTFSGSDSAPLLLFEPALLNFLLEL